MYVKHFLQGVSVSGRFLLGVCLCVCWSIEILKRGEREFSTMEKKTIKVDEELWARLHKLRIDRRSASVSQVIRELMGEESVEVGQDQA